MLQPHGRDTYGMDPKQHIIDLAALQQQLLPVVQSVQDRAIESGTVIDNRLFLRQEVEPDEAVVALLEAALVSENPELESAIMSAAAFHTGESVPRRPTAPEGDDPVFTNDEIAAVMFDSERPTASGDDPRFTTNDLTGVELCPSPQGEDDLFLREEVLAAACLPEPVELLEPDKTMLATPSVPTPTDPAALLRDPNVNRSTDPADLNKDLDAFLAATPAMTGAPFDAIVAPTPEGQAAIDAVATQIAEMDATAAKCTAVAAAFSKEMSAVANELVAIMESVGELETLEFYWDLIASYHTSRSDYRSGIVDEAADIYRKITDIEGRIVEFERVTTEGLNADPLRGFLQTPPAINFGVFDEYNALTGELTRERDRRADLVRRVRVEIGRDAPRPVGEIVRDLAVAVAAFTNEVVIVGVDEFLSLEIDRINDGEDLTGAIGDYTNKLKEIASDPPSDSDEIERRVEERKDMLRKMHGISREAVMKMGRELSAWEVFKILDYGLESNSSTVLLEFKNDANLHLAETRTELNDRKRAQQEKEEYLGSADERFSDELGKAGCGAVPLPEALDAVTPGSDVNYNDLPKPIDKSYPVTDERWWTKFCLLATTVNLIPIHWPIGLILPSPAGPIKIPMPIVWKMVSLVTTVTSMQVMLIGLCGVLPGPAVATINMSEVPMGPVDGKSAWITVAIRPMAKIKDDPGSKPLDAMPLVDVGNGAKIDSNPEFSHSLPMIQDDFPAYERMGLTNPPFLLFLNEWCAAGKKSLGFLEW